MTDWPTLREQMLATYRNARLHSDRVAFDADGSPPITVEIGRLDDVWLEVVARAGSASGTRASQLLEANLELPLGGLCVDGSEIVVRQTLLLEQNELLFEVVDALAAIAITLRERTSAR